MLVIFWFGFSSLFAQEILTAEQFFGEVSSTYAQIDDYQATVRISQGEDLTMEGTLYYKNPNYLRIDFTNPAEQVLASNGEVVFLYLPLHDVVMTQELNAISAGPSREGLKLLSERYSVAYAETPDPVPLEEGSEEMVVKLRFNWRFPDEGFRQIDVAVNEDGLIRRMVGVSKEYDEIVFDLEDIELNQNIPFGRFYYDAPSSAYQVKNFLFGSQ
jgi:outer membrane lipoprotein-sorting protein